MNISICQEIKSASAHLAAHGYKVNAHKNGHLIVEDPVYRCGTGAQAGRLVLAGVKEVVVRSHTDALRFVLNRS